MHGYIDKIASLAEEALTEELDTTPKPGLVDKKGNGAHSDMDYALFKKSIKALKPYLRQFAVASLGNKDLKSLAFSLKEIGIKAEKSMFAATKNVNTHKGAIFSLGLVIGSTVSQNVDRVTNIKTMSRGVKTMAKELEPSRTFCTHGGEVYKKYKVGGAFGQALDGYENVLKLTLPLYEKYSEAGLSDNDANVLVLLNLIATLDDTNALYRAGAESADAARAKAAALLDNFSAPALQCLCIDFENSNISFGGCADMLMLSIFVKKLLENGFLKVF